ncbi:hypothetical protein EI94DRAFT_760777 [Lactarius quietus]|nr:hypothetical protein EI94DRAFT_760777 [Lactarius quietus]
MVIVSQTYRICCRAIYGIVHHTPCIILYTPRPVLSAPLRKRKFAKQSSATNASIASSLNHMVLITCQTRAIDVFTSPYLHQAAHGTYMREERVFISTIRPRYQHIENPVRDCQVSARPNLSPRMTSEKCPQPQPHVSFSVNIPFKCHPNRSWCSYTPR